MKRKFTHYRYIPADPYSISSDNVSVVYEDRAGTLWVGTFEEGLDRFDRRSGTFTHYRYSSNNPKSLSSNAVEVLHEDNEGVLWVGTRNGLNAMDRGSGTFTRHFAFDRPEILQTDIRVVFEIDSATLWLGFFNGLWSFDKRTGIFKHLALGRVGIQAILESRERFLWFASGPLDLTKFDPSTGNITKYTDREFFPTKELRSMLEDNRGNLWLGTSRGLSKFDPRKETFRSYDAGDGLQVNEFIDRSAYKSRNGDMYFGGDNGFTVFHPDSIKDNQYITPVWITTLRVFNTIVRFAKPIMDLDTIEMAHNQNNISFEYVALNYMNAAKNQYKYKLGGFDKEWTNAGTVRIANYTNLDPGEYTFRVKGSNNDGLWNEVGDSLVVIIHPPWWATTWSYGVYIAVFGLVLYGIRRYEMNRLGWKHRMQLEHVQTDKLKEVDQMKSRFFANISHEFRTPLTLILGPIQKWKAKAETGNSPDLQVGDFKTPSQKPGEGFQPLTNTGELQKDLGMAERNTQRLLRLINQLLDLSRIEAGGMKLQAAQGNIVPFVKGIAQSFQSSAGRRSIELNVEAESNEIEVYFDRDKMEKILTNLLSNAFKFTPAGGAVIVHISNPTSPPDRWRAGQIPNQVLITIADTGIGIPADQMDKVFDRFYQVDASQTREQEGTGIGLALTKELVELHHGTIHVRGEVGKGTQFTVRLPLGRSHLKADEIIEAPQRLEPSKQSLEESVPVEEHKVEGAVGSPASESEGLFTEKPIVLVVEDNADVRAYMKEYLIGSYQVEEAKDGAEGIEKAKEIIPDLIISDVMMPNKDGYELCKTLKLDEKTSHVPIILLTAKAGQENKIEGLETGADDYLTKPFDAKELLVRVKNLIDLRRKLRERFSVGQVLKPGEIAVTSIDDAFLQKVKAAVERHISEEEFSVEELAQEVSMSRSQIFRKLTALTGQPPSDFIRYMRLHRAMDLLKKNAGTVSEIAYTVGFNSVTYFTKCFHQQFNVLPSEVRKQQHSP
jgi:signal transduction histidine kinase/DNA-binding response OmpR family regulator